MYRVIKGIGACLGRVSPDTLERLAGVLAVVSFDVVRFRRRLILKNLTIAFGDEFSAAERIRVGRASMKHFFLTSLEFLRSVNTDLLEHTTVEGVEHVKQALADGKGAYLLCCHLGNWEALGGSGPRFVAPTHAIVKEVGRGGVNQLVDELRRKNGLMPIYRKPPGAALRAVHTALKRNELVSFILDQARPGGPLIPFFGTPAKTQTSLAAIWRKTPRPVIPVSIRRISATRHHVTAWPALELNRTEHAERDILDLTAQFNQALEQLIRTCPEQYFWLHNRWKD